MLHYFIPEIWIYISVVSYVGNAFEWSTLKVMLHIVGWQAQQYQNESWKGKIEELNIKCEYVPGNEMSRRPRYDETTYYRRRKPRLDGFFF